MISVQVLDNIAPKGLSLLKPQLYQISSEFTDPEIILVRSHSLHGHLFSEHLRAVGRAGAGTDNIPIEQLTNLGIPVFNSPGANSNAVKELVLAAMLIGYRHLDEARTFLSDLFKENQQEFHQEIEQQKKKFVGHEISGKTLGVIGLGNIGVKVANAALGLGMNVITYDSNISLSNALALMPNVEKANDMNAVLKQADIITLHVPLNAETTHLINEKNINLVKQNALLLNFSRELVVSEKAVLQHLNNKKIMGYITDFPTIELASHPKVLSFPHLGASTAEAEQNSAEMVIRNICNYLEYGTIEYSVNFPNIALSQIHMPNCHRIVIVNRNIPGAIGKITETISQLGYNIEQMVNTSRETIAINLIDISGTKDLPEQIAAYFKAIPSFIRVYVIPNQECSPN